MVGKKRKPVRRPNRRNAPRTDPSRKTRTIVGAKSSNECAFPSCSEPMVKTESNGEDYLAGDLCHIHGKKEGSARYDSSLTPKQIHAPENLLFLCKNHHWEIDEDPDGYPVSRLLEMKAAHEGENAAAARRQLAEVLTLAVENDLRVLRRARFFRDFDSTTFCLGFASRLQGEHSHARPEVRARALAWCTRMLATSRLEEAEACFRLAENLVTGGTVPLEVRIAHAFLRARHSDVSGALHTLNALGSPPTTEAALVLLNRYQTPAAAISWMRDHERTLPSLDSDGRLMHLVSVMQAGQWGEVDSSIAQIQNSDYENTPALHYAVGIAMVALQTPEDLRFEVGAAMPISALNFPISSTPSALSELRNASEHFEAAATAAEAFALTDTVNVARDYALWLQLRDPIQAASAKMRLADAVARLPENLRLLPMAIQGDVPFEKAHAERVIDERLSSSDPRLSADAASARLALAFTMEPRDAAKYLERHTDSLAPYIARPQITMHRAEFLMLASEWDAAGRLVEDLRSTDLPDSEMERLQSLLRYSKAEDVRELTTYYERTGATKDLGRAVMEMQRRAEWDGVYKYGEQLFDRTGSLEDAERLATALIALGKDDELSAFLDKITYLVDRSGTLRMIQCWHLFNRGRARECGAMLKKLAGSHSDPNVDSLRFNLAVVTGDWMSIPKLVAEGFEDRATKDTSDLVQLAHRSLYFDLPYTKDLVHAIADRGDRDVHALATAAWLGGAANMDRDPRVGQWLRRAIERSDGDGPMKGVSLPDFVRHRKQWNERVEKISEDVRRGDMPLCVAGDALNRAVSDFVLRCAIENRRLGDRGRRGVVAAYSGVRGDTVVENTGAVGVGPTALMTLSLLDKLESTIGSMEEVVIPHGTLAWLFVERERLRFHQPSRIDVAKRVVDLEAEGLVTVVSREETEIAVAREEIGEDAASLLAAMEGSADARSMLVVSYPIEKLVGDEIVPVDMRSYYGRLVSPATIVRVLAEDGHITADERDAMIESIARDGRRWPMEPALRAGDALYLDGVSLENLLDLGPRPGDVLRLLNDDGYRLYVSKATIEEHRGLLRHVETSKEIGDHVENIRRVLHDGIESGRVHLGPLWRGETKKEREAARYPELELVRLASRCSAVMTDDRFLNQHRGFEAGESVARVWTTWDWILSQAEGSRRAGASFADAARVLRQAGYLFVPILGTELQEVGAARVVDGKVKETPGLRAIRREVELVRESRCLQWPKESPWLTRLVGACASVVGDLWCDSGGTEEIVARVNWVHGLLSAGDWGLLAPPDAERGVVEHLVAGYREVLGATTRGLPEDRKRRYREWVAAWGIAAPATTEEPDASERSPPCDGQ